MVLTSNRWSRRWPIDARVTAVLSKVCVGRADGKRKETIPQFLVLDAYAVQIQVFGTLCINGLNEGHKTSISNIVRFHNPLHLGTYCTIRQQTN